MSDGMHIIYWRDKCKKLEKALDKACEELENFSDTYECYFEGQEEPHRKEQWKEYLLNEDVG